MRRVVPDHLDQHRFPTDPWRLVDREYDVNDLGLTETLFAVANGYIGMRANPEEGRDAHSHGSSTASTRHGTSAMPRRRTDSPRPARRSSTSPTPS